MRIAQQWTLNFPAKLKGSPILARVPDPGYRTAASNPAFSSRNELTWLRSDAISLWLLCCDLWCGHDQLGNRDRIAAKSLPFEDRLRNDNDTGKQI